MMEKVSRARLALMFKASWLAVPAFRLQVEIIEPHARPPGFRGIAATDGKRIIFDREFLEKAEDEAVLTVTAHEVLHCVLLHFFRSERFAGINPEILNIAMDYAVNWVLVDSGFKLIRGSLYSKRFHGMTFEEILRELLKLQNGGSQSGGEDDSGQAGSGPGRKQQKGGLTDISLTSTPEEVDPEELLRGDAPYVQIDDHSMLVSDESAADRKAEWIKETVRIRTYGTLPSGLKVLIDRLLTPMVPWRMVLRQYVQRLFGGEYRWVPPNKRTRHLGRILPRFTFEEGLEIAVAIDTSGSTVASQDVKDFMSELRGIMSAYKYSRIHVFMNDAKVQEYFVLESHTNINWDEILRSKVRGGGGTVFTPVFEEIQRKGLDVSLLVFLTDSWGVYPDSAPGYPVLWVIADRESYRKPPFGDVLFLR